MAQHIETALPHCSLPENLTKLVEDRLDGFVGANGFETRVMPWKLPISVCQVDREGAARALPSALAACEPASAADLGRWLVSLGTLMAGNLSAADAQMKISAYVGLLQAPSGMMTREALERAARRFKFFPAFAELAEFVDAERAALSERARRLRQVAAFDVKTTTPARNVVPIPVKIFPKQDWGRVRAALVGSEGEPEVHEVKPRRNGIPSVKDWLSGKGVGMTQADPERDKP